MKTAPSRPGRAALRACLALVGAVQLAACRRDVARAPETVAPVSAAPRNAAADVVAVRREDVTDVTPVAVALNAGEVRWIEAPYPVRPKSVAVRANGEVVVAGSQIDAAERHQWAAIVRASGSVRHVLGAEGAVTAVARGRGADLLLVGSTGQTFASQASITRLTSDDTLRVAREFPDGDDASAEVYGARVASDGILIAGLRNPITSGVTHGWLALLADDMQQETWSLRLGSGAYFTLTDAAMLPDRSVIAVGMDSTGRRYKGWVVRVDASGVVRSQQTLGTNGWQTLTSLAVTRSGAVWALGDSARAQPAMNVRGPAWLVRLGPSGAGEVPVTWQGLLRDRVIAHSEVVALDESAVFAATTDGRGAGSYLVRADAQGHDQWSAIPVNAPDARVVATTATDDGTVVVLGTTGVAPTPRWWLYRG